ncbi:beta strand repeat-containing protein, partial [Helicobacter labacensis]|uniref:beta strand repeat-containing protein n=1 Tax=Helicobacter labacensis TaxID=2316079 RepID=UPI000EB18C09
MDKYPLRTPNSKGFISKTLSLALGACFGLVPSVDAEEVNVISMVNSISGILGGNYTLGANGNWTGTADQSFGSAITQSNITNPAGNQPYFGDGSLNNPYNTGGASGVTSTMSSVLNNNLYGNGGLLSNYSTQANIYDFSSINQVLSNMSANNSVAYGYRSAFGGVGATNNILLPGTGVSNNYYSISNQNAPGSLSNTATVTGNFGSSSNSGLLSTPSNAASANALLGNIYTNILNITAGVNVLPGSSASAGNALSTYSTDLQGAFGTVSSVGGNFVGALNNSSSSSALSGALSTLNTVLYGSSTTDKLISSQTASDSNAYTAYSVNSSGLNTLQTIDAIASAIPGGLVSSNGSGTYTINSNYTAVMTNLKSMASDISVIINGVLNTPLSDVTSVTSSNQNAMGNLSTVLDALANLTASKSYNQSAVESALKGLVNPNTNIGTPASPGTMGTGTGTASVTNGYEAVYYAYTALMKSSALTNLQSALSANASSPLSLGQTLKTAFELDQALSAANSGVGKNSGLSNFFNTASFDSSTSGATMLKTLYEAFASGNSSNSYNTLEGALSKLSALVNTNAFTSSNVVTASSAPLSGGTANANTTYPVSGQLANSKNVTTSWNAQRVLNQNSYESTFNSALAQLLAQAMTYSANTQSLSSMLSSTGVSQLANILNAGINNAAANYLYDQGPTSPFSSGTGQGAGKVDALNQQAQNLNNIQAIFNSENLLNSYVNAITKTYTTESNQEAQASALTYLASALGAGKAQNGLIAQTKQAIYDNLNQNFAFTSALSQADIAKLGGAVGGLPTTLLNPSITMGQLATGFDALSSAVGMINGLTSVTSKNVTTAYSTLESGLGAAMQVQNLITSVGSAVPDLNTVLANIINGTTTDLSKIAGWSSLSSDVQNALEDLAGATAKAPNTPTKASPLTTLSGLLTTGTAGQGLAFGTSTIEPSDVGALLGTVKTLVGYASSISAMLAPNFTSQLSSVVAGSNLAQELANAMNNASTFASSVGNLAPSVASQFENGTLSATDISAQIANIKSLIAPYEAMGTNASASSGTPALSIGLSSYLGSGVSAVQNLGFASAAVNTLSSQLGDLLPYLSSTDTTNGLFTTTNLNNISSALSALNSAVGNLYNASSTLFSNANLNTTSNMNGPTNSVIGLGGVGGVASNSNASAYLTNLNNLYTLSSLIGDFVGNNAMSTAYTSLFGNNASAASGLINGSAQTNIAALTNTANLATGASLTEVVSALMPIQAQLVANTITQDQANTAATNALAGLAASGKASTLWDAYQSVMGFGVVSKVAQTVNYVSGINKNLAQASQQNLSTAAGIAQVLTDANNLYNANKALASVVTGGNNTNNFLTVSASSSAANSASNLNAAISAANAFGKLLPFIKSADLGGTNGATTVSSITTLINAINSYNHNVTLLNNLTNSQGGKIAGDVLNYLQGQTDFKNLSNQELTKLNELQTLLNRLQYLEGVQSQVQSAIATNPFAMVMQKNQTVKADAYQSAANNLVTYGTNQGLFNATLSSTLNTGITLNSGSQGADLSGSAYGNTVALVSNDLSNVSAWNSMINQLNTSDSILQNPAQSATTPMTSLNSIASSVYNLTGYMAPATTSNNAISTTTASSTFGNMINAYSTIATEANTLGQNLFNINSPTGNITIANVTGEIFDGNSSTFLQSMEGVVTLGSMLKPFSGQTNGLSSNATLLGNVATAVNTTLGAEISAITTTFTGAGGGAFSSISDLSTGITGITS